MVTSALAEPAKKEKTHSGERSAFVEPLEPRQLLSVSISTVVGNANEQGQTHAQYAVTRDVTSGSSTATVYFSVGYGTASGDDFVSVTSSAVYLPGTSTVYLDVVPADDSLSEPTETFTVSLTSCIGDTIATSQAAGTITDNDPPRVWVEAIQDGAEDAQTPAEFVFHRVGQLASGQKAYFALSGNATLGEGDEDGNAIDDADYGGATLSTDTGETGNYEISFGSAESVTLTLTPFNDALVEGDEAIDVSICAAPGNTMYADPAGNAANQPANAEAKLKDLTIGIESQSAGGTTPTSTEISTTNTLIAQAGSDDPDVRAAAQASLLANLNTNPGLLSTYRTDRDSNWLIAEQVEALGSVISSFASSHPFWASMQSDGQLEIEPDPTLLPVPTGAVTIRVFVYATDNTIVDVQTNAANEYYKDFPVGTDGLTTGEKYIPKVSEETTLHVILQYRDQNGALLAQGERFIYVLPHN
jgi:hypothetical protein